jgi:cysteine synthase A
MGAEAPVGITALSAIGETPLVRLVRLPQSREAQVWVKLEMFNPTGSYKDRMALGLIEGAEARGELTPGRTVVERTRGSTGSSLALVCAVKGYPLKVVSSDAFSAAKLATMPALGAELIVVPSLDGGVTAELMEDMRCQVDRIVQDEDAFYTDQFNNPDSVVGYEPAGDEIIEQLGGPPDVFCAGVGTCGFLTGVGRRLRRASASVRVVAIEPANSAVLSGRPPGSHRIEGIGVGVVPPHFDPDLVDRVMTISEAEAVATARSLARREGIFAGFSSGLNVAAACRLAAEKSPSETVVTVAVDSGLKYLDGDLFASS